MLGPLEIGGCRAEGVPSPDSSGLVRCRWPVAFSLTIPEDWPSGFYLAALRNAEGKESAIPFVVREALPRAPILCQIPVTSYQAYNNWGGKSLYDSQSGGARALRVSFDRPYSCESLFGDRGFFYCDLQLVRWLESRGYSVAYCTNLDIDREPDLAAAHALFLSSGHDEYWSLAMREHVERAQAAGTHLLFLSADTCHWVVRLEDGGRVMTCYKAAEADPGSPATVRFRDPEIGRPSWL